MHIDRKQEKACIAKVVELGNSQDPASITRLINALKYPSFHVRRLAISAIGKLANVAENPPEFIPVLIYHLHDPHPQIRQYSIKALRAYGIHSKQAIGDLEDISANPAEKEYNKKDAKKTLEVIAEAIRIKECDKIHCCQKCSVVISEDEYARSQKAFQRNYCDKCFDEVYLSRRNFDTKVELNKIIRTKDGTFVQSDGERRIAEWLTKNFIAFRYDERFRIIDGMAVRPDFYLPELDLYIEYWGMDTLDYKIGMMKKQQLYQQEGKKVISLYPKDKDNLDQIMKTKLGKYIKFP